MPDVRNCKRCGRVYNYIGGVPLCPSCKDQDENDFKRIKSYLYDNPGAPMSLVASELDVSVEKIRRFLKEGRLEIVGDDANFILQCEGCGISIKTGRFCNSCERNVVNDLSSTAQKLGQSAARYNEEIKRNSSMRYLSKDEKQK